MEKTWYIYAAHTIYGLGAVLSEKRAPEREDDLYDELRYERTPELIEHLAKDGVSIVIGKPCDAATAGSMFIAIRGGASSPALRRVQGVREKVKHRERCRCRENKISRRDVRRLARTWAGMCRRGD